MGMDAFFPACPEIDLFFRERITALLSSEKARKKFLSVRDPFGKIWSDLLSKKDRLVLGEFYTPDHLADYLLEKAISFYYEDGEKNTIPLIIDPCCGSGSFLLSAAIKWNQENVPVRTILSRLAGIDLNPLAVFMCRAHLLIALAQKFNDRLEIPDLFLNPDSANLFKIFSFDSLLSDCPEKEQFRNQCDILLGNPPWITWDQLSEKYRKAISFLWEKYHLFSLSGKEVLYGGSKKDISSLMICSGMDDFLKMNGILGSIIPMSLLKTRGAGEGFRLFLAGKNGSPCSLLEVDDLSGISPFEMVGNRTGGILVRKIAEDRTSIPYLTWKKENGNVQIHRSCLQKNEDAGAPFSVLRNNQDSSLPADFCSFQEDKIHAIAQEDRSSSVSPKKSGNSERKINSGYRAQLGANTAGANGIYWIAPSNNTSQQEPGLVRMKNLMHLGKREIPQVEMLVEEDLVFPLLRWKDVDAFSAKPSGLIIIPQDPETRRGIDEKTMKVRYPKSYEFFSHFEQELKDRAAWRRFQSRSPFWSMYNVDRNTFAPYKVVWRRMDSRIRAAVVFNEIRNKPIIPQETLSIIAVDSLEEADYLAAQLNSVRIQDQVASFSLPGSKGFGAPGILANLDLPKFDSKNPDHLHFSQYGRTMREKNT